MLSNIKLPKSANLISHNRSVSVVTFIILYLTNTVTGKVFTTVGLPTAAWLCPGLSVKAIRGFNKKNYKILPSVWYVEGNTLMAVHILTGDGRPGQNGD